MKELWGLVKILSFSIIIIVMLHLIDIKISNRVEIQKEKIGAVQQLSDKGAKICTSLE